jgi:hypothetical protein
VALSDPTSILFRTQLQFFPIEELAFEKRFVRQLYGKLAEPGGYPYDDISFEGSTSTLSTKRKTHRGTGRSVCKVTDHAISVEELEPEGPLGSFVEVVQTVLKVVAEVKTDCPPIIIQRCWIQSFARPLQSKNSISLLAGKVSDVLTKIVPFDRPPAFFGLRFRFPPYKIVDDGETEHESEDAANEDDIQRELRNFVALRFETWGQDVSQVWIEVAAQYLFENPNDVTETQKISDNIKDAYDFLTTKAIPFLNQFDQPGPADNQFDKNEDE